MSNQLVFHPATWQQITAFNEKPSHALLLLGPGGAGKLSVATLVAETLLQLKASGLEKYPYQKILGPADGKSISIEAIRELDQFLSLKVPAQTEINRIVIIENSHLLTVEAQNALLKTLEEPPTGTVIILTANNTQTLLPTITSRSQTITIQTPPLALVTEHFTKKYSAATDVNRAYAMSAGLPGLLDALLSDADHPLLESANVAKAFIQGTTFTRLSLVDSLSKQRLLTENVLFMLGQMAHLSLRTAEGSAAKRWRSIMEESYQAYQALHQNAQPKLVLTKLALHL